MSLLRNKIVSISSRNRSTGTATDFSIKLDGAENYFNGTFLAYLKRGTIPHSWYNIRPGDTIQFAQSPSNTARTLTITPGSYNYYEFATELKTQLDALATIEGNGATYSVTYSETTGKYTISASGGVTFIFNALASNNPNSVGALRVARHIGLPDGLITSSTNSYVSDNIPDTFGTKNLYLLSPNAEIQSLFEQEFRGQGRNNVSVIQVPVNKFQIINFFNSDPEGSRRVWRNPGNGILRWQLVDDDGEIVPLNGLDFKFEINFQQL
jgi:hypothetical protein